MKPWPVGGGISLLKAGGGAELGDRTSGLRRPISLSIGTGQERFVQGSSPSAPNSCRGERGPRPERNTSAAHGAKQHPDQEPGGGTGNGATAPPRNGGHRGAGRGRWQTLRIKIPKVKPLRHAPYGRCSDERFTVLIRGTSGARPRSPGSRAPDRAASIQEPVGNGNRQGGA